MNINFGLFPPVEGKFKGKIGGKEKRKALSSRALNDLENYLLENPENKKRAASGR